MFPLLLLLSSLLLTNLPLTPRPSEWNWAYDSRMREAVAESRRSVGCLRVRGCQKKKPVAWLQQHLYPLVAMAMSCVSLVHVCARASAPKTFLLDFGHIFLKTFFVFFSHWRLPLCGDAFACLLSERESGEWGRGLRRLSATHSAGLPPPWLTPRDSVSNYHNIYPSVRGRSSKH